MGYGVDFGFNEYVRMAELMKSMQGKAVLSINDHPDIRAVFNDFVMDTVGINYTVGGAGKPAKRQELIIRNW